MRQKTPKNLVWSSRRSFLALVPVWILAACDYPSNVVHDMSYMGNPAYEECRRRASAESNYGAECAKVADQRVQAERNREARQALERRQLADAEADRREAEQRREDDSRGYRRVQVREFLLDGRELATRSARISLVGVYLPVGPLELMFGSPGDAIQFANGGSLDAPAVSLLTGDATREFRAQALNCRSSPATPYTGCSARILGVASMCTLTNPFGVRREVACVAVSEGSVGPN